MRKLMIAVASTFFFFSSAVAQNKNLVVQGASPDLYLTHVVTAKENYYSLGRLYNVSPKDLAPYNNLQFEKGLSLGQTIKIPLTQNNFVQSEEVGPNEALIPLYHVVQAKEGLYRVSVTYNKVSFDQLKKWNKLPSETVSNGTKLIVGYLKVDKEQSPLAKTDAVHPSEIVAEKKDDKKEKPFVQTKTTTPLKDEVAKNDEKKTDEKKTDIKKPEEKKPETKKVVEVKEKPIETKPVETKPVATTTTNNSTTAPAANFSGGYFKKTFSDQAGNKSLVTENGAAGVFKTTSGWQDGKYYCFYNEAEPGTILKITNTTNGKSVYAKVLDAVPDIKQNSGLMIRLSNAAAEELGAGENKFDCSISYSK